MAINANSSATCSGVRRPASLLGFLALLFATTFLTGCPTRTEIEAAIWRNNGPIPPSICKREPKLEQLGFLRTLDNGEKEFISFCKPCNAEGKECVREWLSAHQRDVDRMLDAALPKPQH